MSSPAPASTVPDPHGTAARAADVIARESGVPRHDLAIVLGSGWGQSADLLGRTVWEAPATDVPGFSAPALAGHTGMLRSVLIEGTASHVLVLGARTHFYEGKGVDAVVHGVRTAAAAGARTLVLTNGCGGLRPDWTPGTPVLISDHINITGANPIAGAHFVDMTDVYRSHLRDIARHVDPSLDEGVYIQFAGPSYETPAEVRMARTLGADLVGMSTALEAIAAREAGLDVLGLSLVTNLAAGISPTPLDHGEVVQAGRDAAPRLGRLLADIVVAVAAETTQNEEDR